jgi:hypothetical protein
MAIGAPSDRFEQELSILRKLLAEVASRASGVMPTSAVVAR